MQVTGPDGQDESIGSEGARDSRLRWYPRAWRIRYGDEFSALLDDEYGSHLPVLVRFGLVTGGVRERCRQSGLSGDSAPAADRARSGALLVLVAWSVFVIAGASFAKFSEHFDQALPHSMGAHRIPDLAFTWLQTAAVVASSFVVVGALLAVPAVVQLFRSGGWAPLRGHAMRALLSSGLLIVVTVPLLVWAHHLSPEERNGGLHWYGALFTLWAVLIALSLLLWTAVGVAIARRARFSRTVLATEAVLAVATAAAMTVMLVATAVWWGCMANQAPTYLSASPGSPWNLWLIITVSLMTVAVTLAAVGVVRQRRVWAIVKVGEP